MPREKEGIGIIGKADIMTDIDIMIGTKAMIIIQESTEGKQALRIQMNVLIVVGKDIGQMIAITKKETSK